MSLPLWVCLWDSALREAAADGWGHPRVSVRLRALCGRCAPQRSLSLTPVPLSTQTHTATTSSLVANSVLVFGLVFFFFFLVLLVFFGFFCFVLFCFSLVFDCQNSVGLSTMWQPFESRLNISWKIILTLSHLCILLTLETSFINTVHWGLVITCSLCMHCRPGDLNQAAQFSLLGLMQGLAIPVCGPDLFTR